MMALVADRTTLLMNALITKRWFMVEKLERLNPVLSMNAPPTTIAVGSSRKMPT